MAKTDYIEHENSLEDARKKHNYGQSWLRKQLNDPKNFKSIKSRQHSWHEKQVQQGRGFMQPPGSYQEPTQDQVVNAVQAASPEQLQAYLTELQNEMTRIQMILAPATLSPTPETAPVTLRKISVRKTTTRKAPKGKKSTAKRAAPTKAAKAPAKKKKATKRK